MQNPRACFRRSALSRMAGFIDNLADVLVNRPRHCALLSCMSKIANCDRPRQNQAYCAGYQSEIQAYLVAQGDNYRFSLFGVDR